MRHIVVGGGVAGVCCAEQLCQICPPTDSIVLISADSVLKGSIRPRRPPSPQGVSLRAKLTRRLEHLQVEERHLDDFPHPGFRLLRAIATGINISEKQLFFQEMGGTSSQASDRKSSAHDSIPYDRLCICTGAAPRELACTPGSHDVLTLRDTDSVDRLSQRLAGARRVVIAGNGGIALEAAHALRGLDVVWATRHGHIGEAFFDGETATFLETELLRDRNGTAGASTSAAAEGITVPSLKRPKCETAGSVQSPGSASVRYANDDGPTSSGLSRNGPDAEVTSVPSKTMGHAVGPLWITSLPPSVRAGSGTLQIVRDAEVATISRGPHEMTRSDVHAWREQSSGLLEAKATYVAAFSPSTVQSPSIGSIEQSTEPPLTVTLSDGQEFRADLVLAALGVMPETRWAPGELSRSADGALIVDCRMRTSAPDIWAAGDVAERRADDSPDAPRHWFGMRLWSTARAGGVLAAQGMASEDPATVEPGMSFELFAHATSFLGRRVVFLGLYNGQRLEGDDARDVLAVSRVSEDQCGKGKSFVRVVLLRGKVQGAVLVGDIDLADTFENLILDQLYVGDVGPALLDPDIDLADIFD